jgi:hypothetical protein
MIKLTAFDAGYEHVTCDFRVFGICGCAIQLGDFFCLVFAGPYSQGYSYHNSRIKELI